MIKRLRLTRYKAFEQFDASFRSGMNVLVGPNNAGKSTLIAILRLCSILFRNAQRVNPSISIADKGRNVIGHPLASARLRELPGYTDENVHYEFRSEEARVEATSHSGSSLIIVWPADSDPYYYVDIKPGMNARNRGQVTSCAPTFGVVPGLTPIEDQEEVLTPQYVERSFGSRLTSRHFRNYLYHLQQSDEDEYAAAIAFMIENTPEISDAWLRSRVEAGAVELDFFFKEAVTNSERELFWAGDGMQIWLQVLFHAFSLREVETLVLDEPDVFLHPDLQRRLVGVLEGLGPQVILATHAPEIIAESSRESILAIDRSRRHGSRIRDTLALDRLVADLGSAFDLAIARALRSRVTLFVEGQDMKVLRILAETVGARSLARERSQAAVVPLGGYSNWPLIEPFAWMKEHILQDSVKMFVILDRDYRTREDSYDVVDRLGRIDVSAHVWTRKELESYLLVPAVVSRVSGLPIETAESLLSVAVDAQETIVESNIFNRLFKSSKGRDAKTVLAECRTILYEVWTDFDSKVVVAPAKDVIAALNGEIAAMGGRTVSARKLAAEISVDEIDPEVVDLLRDIECTILQRT